VPIHPTAKNAKDCTAIIPNTGDLSANPKLLDCVVDLIQGDCLPFATTKDASDFPLLAACVVSGAPGLAMQASRNTTTSLDKRAQPVDIGRCVQDIVAIAGGSKSLGTVLEASQCIATVVKRCENVREAVAKIISNRNILTIAGLINALKRCIAYL
jgi:hypothetical protein